MKKFLIAFSAVVVLMAMMIGCSEMNGSDEGDIARVVAINGNEVTLVRLIKVADHRIETLKSGSEDKPSEDKVVYGSSGVLENGNDFVVSGDGIVVGGTIRYDEYNGLLPNVTIGEGMQIVTFVYGTDIPYVTVVGEDGMISIVPGGIIGDGSLVGDGSFVIGGIVQGGNFSGSFTSSDTYEEGETIVVTLDEQTVSGLKVDDIVELQYAEDGSVNGVKAIGGKLEFGPSDEKDEIDKKDESSDEKIEENTSSEKEESTDTQEKDNG